ncbi:hypothetical protein IFM89_019814 [Coptis chinensis]|uniref:Rx N-terminal domain-containing protein n=1 Tax=Coptis chinensis TaxID=261450 RepID=A0A835IBB5_9MAGN|nr:hypothetical protein IFM89_019814 [Coptis chinensis]
MTHAVISGVLEQLRSILQTDQINLLAGVRNESEKLNDTLLLIQGVLEDAEEKEVKNGAVKAWLEQLTRISYDADDVLDDWKTRILSSQIQLLDDDIAPVSEKAWYCLFSLFSCLKSVVVRHDDGSKMIDINERLDRIVKDKALLDLNERQSREEPLRSTSSFVDGSEIYGRTLKLNRCTSLRKLPEGIGKLLNLRHLELEGTYELSYFPRGLERLSCLRTLSKVVLDRDGGKGCQIGELKLLDHIQGELRIEGLGQVADSKQAELKKKEKLRSLALVFPASVFSEEKEDEERQENRKRMMESVFDGLQPHTNLAELRIEGYEGNRFPLWISSINTYLPKLVKLELHECNQCSELPALGRLQNDMPEWEEQGDEIKLPIRRRDEEEGFIMPCLCELVINSCPKLKVVPHYLFSPALRSLAIWNCPQLTGRQPCLPPLLEKLVLNGNTGFLSKSILPLLMSGIGSPDHNDTTNNENDYPNLHSFSIIFSEESSLPQGFNQLTAIQTLEFWSCKFLDFKPEDLKHLPKLQLLRICRCPILKERCRKRESWTTNSHIPKIELNLDDFIPE